MSTSRGIADRIGTRETFSQNFSVVEIRLHPCFPDSMKMAKMTFLARPFPIECMDPLPGELARRQNVREEATWVHVVQVPPDSQGSDRSSTADSTIFLATNLVARRLSHLLRFLLPWE